MIYVLPTGCAGDYLLKSPQAQSGGGPGSTVEGAERRRTLNGWGRTLGTTWAGKLHTRKEASSPDLGLK